MLKYMLISGIQQMQATILLKNLKNGKGYGLRIAHERK